MLCAMMDAISLSVCLPSTVIEMPAPVTPGPRERALHEGMSALSDADLLAIVLGTGMPGCPVMQLANTLLTRLGGLEGLSRLGPLAIADHPGVGQAKALRMSAALELGRRSVARATRPRQDVGDSQAVAAWFTGRMGWSDHEEMWVLGLDSRNGLRTTRRVAQGGLHGCSVLPRDVLRAALQESASAIVLVHNHPGGDPTPSPEDLEMTGRVARAGHTVGVPLLDHVIVSSTGRYVSMLDLGVMPSA